MDWLNDENAGAVSDAMCLWCVDVMIDMMHGLTDLILRVK